MLSAPGLEGVWQASHGTRPEALRAEVEMTIPASPPAGLIRARETIDLRSSKQKPPNTLMQPFELAGIMPEVLMSPSHHCPVLAVLRQGPADRFIRAETSILEGLGFSPDAENKNSVD
jgi:hypothetical protein